MLAYAPTTMAHTYEWTLVFMVEPPGRWTVLHCAHYTTELAERSTTIKVQCQS